MGTSGTGQRAVEQCENPSRTGRVVRGVGGERKEAVLGQGQRRENTSEHPGRGKWKQALRATLGFLLGVLRSVGRSAPSMRTWSPASPA